MTVGELRKLLEYLPKSAEVYLEPCGLPLDGLVVRKRADAPARADFTVVVLLPRPEKRP